MVKYLLSPAEGTRTQALIPAERFLTVLGPLAAVTLTSLLTGCVLVLGKITKVPRRRKRNKRRREGVGVGKEAEDYILEVN